MFLYATYDDESAVQLEKIQKMLDLLPNCVRFGYTDEVEKVCCPIQRALLVCSFFT
jgi:hypothetical protein